MKTNIIKAENLKKSYGTLEVLKGVDFTVERGEIFALLGSNGAGKTTVVKILSTLLRGDGGSAAICGFDVKRQSRQVKGCISLVCCRRRSPYRKRKPYFNRQTPALKKSG